MSDVDLTEFSAWLATQKIRPWIDEKDQGLLDPVAWAASGRPMNPRWASILLGSLRAGLSRGVDLTDPRQVNDWILGERGARLAEVEARGTHKRGRTKDRTVQTAYGYLTQWKPAVFHPLPPLQLPRQQPRVLNPNEVELAIFHVLYDVDLARCRYDPRMVARLRWLEVRHNPALDRWEIRQTRGNHASHPLEPSVRVALAVLRRWSPPRKPRYPVIPAEPGSDQPLAWYHLQAIRQQVFSWYQQRGLLPEAITGYFEGRVVLRLRSSPKWSSDLTAEAARPELRAKTPAIESLLQAPPTPSLDSQHVSTAAVYIAEIEAEAGETSTLDPAQVMAEFVRQREESERSEAAMAAEEIAAMESKE